MNQKRNPDQTREALLAAAFEEIHAAGFRSTSIDNILKRTGVTKGALYHHFPNKTALGYAVVDEVIMPFAQTLWAKLEDESRDPVDTLLEIGNDFLADAQRHDVSLGCPINNLVQEMAGLDEGFRTRLNDILTRWRETIQRALERGQANGQVRRDLKASEAAAFLVASYEGSTGLAKCACDESVLDACLKGMRNYVKGLRTPTVDRAVA